MNELEKQRRILRNYLLYFICFFIVIFVCVNDVFGLTYIDIGDKADITVVLVSTDYNSAPINVPKNSAYNLYQVTEIDYLVSNYNFEANKNYQLESHLSNQTLTNANYYSVTGANGENCLISYENSIFTGTYPRWAFQCPTATSSITLTIKNSNNQYLWAQGQTNIFTWTSALLKYSETSLSSGDSNTDDIINNNNQNTQNIINNNNDNTQEIINNQNDNTDRLIEDNKKTFNDCRDSVNLLPQPYSLLTENKTLNGIQVTLNEDYSISLNGTATSTSYLNISYGNAFFTSNVYGGNCNNNYCLSSGLTYDNNNHIIYFYIPNGVTFNNFIIYPMITTLDNRNSSYEIYGQEICTNVLKEQEKTSKGILGKLGDLFTSFTNFVTNLFDTSGPDTDSLSGMAGWLPAGPVDSIINLPLTFFNNLTSSIGSSCTAVNVPLPFVSNTLSLPCFTTIIASINGASTLWTFIGTITTCLLLYYYLKSLYKWIDNKLALNEDTDWGGI